MFNKLFSKAVRILFYFMDVPSDSANVLTPHTIISSLGLFQPEVSRI